MAEYKPPVRRVRNLSYAAIAGQAGCWIVIIVFAALFGGLWLDAQFGMRGPFTVGCIVISIPVSLYIVVRIVLALVKIIQPQPQDQEHTNTSLKEDDL